MSAARPASEARAWRADLAWLAALVLLTRLPDFFRHFHDWDEAAMMAEAWAMTRGQALYRDIPQFHPFLNFALFTPFFAWLKPAAAPHAIKVFNALAALGGAWLARRLALAWTRDRDCGLAAALLFAALVGRDWSVSSYGEFYLLIPVLLAAVLLQAPRPRWFAVGLLWGAAFFIKQVAVFDAAALTAGALALRGRPADETARPLGETALGGAAAFALAAAWLAWNGALSEGLRSMFLRPFDYRSLPGLGFWQRLGLFREHMLSPILEAFAPCWALAGGALAAAAIRRGKERPELAAPIALCSAWFAADLVGIWFIGKMNFHYALVLVAPACLLAALCLRAAPARLRPAARLALAAFLFLAAAIQSVPRLRFLSAHGWTDPDADVSRQIAAFIKGRTRPEDAIFLYGVRNLDVFYLSERLSSNGIYMFIDMEAAHMRDADLETLSRRRLAEHPPALIVADLVSRFPGASASGRDFVAALLRDRYVPLASLGTAVIYGPSTPPAAP